MAKAPKRRQRARGSVEELPSGALRVVVYAGIDPVTKRRHYLRETIPANTPKAAEEAERAIRRLQSQVDERRQPRTNASLSQLIDRHLELAELDETTLRTYRGYVRNHIEPLIGKLRSAPSTPTSSTPTTPSSVAVATIATDGPSPNTARRSHTSATTAADLMNADPSAPPRSARFTSS
ncbi:hypothetical protein ACGFIF_43575 [Kribbella sp. NPDC049174]|uniref:hypothetical protein n=1 Tax=Kribbella sp. NPDC049174 TaxID=3364112 RepID=UPI003711D90C